MKRPSSMVLFLTICSFTKADGGESAYDEGSAIASVLPPKLKARLLERREAVRRLVKGRADVELQGNPLSEHEFNRVLARGADFGGGRTAAYLPAAHRYDGRFFLALGAKLAESRHHVLFLSGLYGLLRPSEPIQLYSCPLSVQVAELWNSDSLLTELLCEYMRGGGVAKVFDLTGVDAYRRLIDWPKIADSGVEVLHCFSASAAGDSALPFFGKLLASGLLDLSEADLVGVRTETEMGSVRFRSLPRPAPGYPKEVAEILSARQEEDLLLPLPPESLGEYVRGGNPILREATDAGDGKAGKREWRFTATTKFVKDLNRLPDLVDLVFKAVGEIRQHPTSPRGNTVKPLTRDLKGMWRYRIGDYRLVYRPDDERRVVHLRSVSNRKDVYE